MPRRKTHDEFVIEVFGICGDEYKVLSHYIDAKEKLEIEHTFCHRKYDVSPNNFLRGRRCPYCSSNKKKTHDEFVEEVYCVFSNEYTVIGKYINNNTKIKVKHNICNREYEVLPTQIIKGVRCSLCEGNKKKTKEEFAIEVYNLVGDEYRVISGYSNSFTKITMIHEICSNEWETTPNGFLHCGVRCAYCYKKNRFKTHEEFVEQVNYLSDGEFTVVGQYKGSHLSVSIRHEVCNKQFEITANTFLTNLSCSSCNLSRGEQRVDNFLRKESVKYYQEYRFEDCRNLRSLPFDFVVLDNLDNMLIIEYDGEQHFQLVSKFDENAFERTQQNDKIKNDYCEINNIPLLRIPYWEFNNIEYILNEFLTKHNILLKEAI